MISSAGRMDKDSFIMLGDGIKYHKSVLSEASYHDDWNYEPVEDMPEVHFQVLQQTTGSHGFSRYFGSGLT